MLKSSFDIGDIITEYYVKTSFHALPKNFMLDLTACYADLIIISTHILGVLPGK